MPVALITGCSRGIGHALALALAARGWTVVATLRGDAGRAALEAAGVDVRTADVRDQVRVETVVHQAAERHGGLDLVVANAGIGLLGCFEDLGVDQVQQVVDVNLLGLMHTVRPALPHLRARRGTLVLVSSVAGRRAAPGSSVYNATKFAVEGFGEALRFELAPLGVPVVLLEPGATRTGFSDARETGHHSGRGPYAAITARIREINAGAFDEACDVDVVVTALLRALERPTPPLRVAVGPGVVPQILARRFLPERFYEWLAARKLALPHGPAAGGSGAGGAA